MVDGALEGAKLLASTANSKVLLGAAAAQLLPQLWAFALELLDLR